MNQKIIKYLIFFLILITVSFSSCYKHEEGCRDINAANYSVKADLDCEKECCSYPEVEIQIRIIYDSKMLDTTKFFPLDNRDSIRIKMLRIYFSDFVFSTNDGSIFPVYQDVYLGKRLNNSVDYSLINYSALKFKPESSSYTIGKSKKMIIADKLSFIFGLKPEINHSVTDKVGTSSPLYKSQDSIYINETNGFYFMKMSIVSKNEPNLVKTILISNESNIKNLVINSTFNLLGRNRHIIKLDIDAENLFKGVKYDDFELNAPNLIIENLTKSVLLKID